MHNDIIDLSYLKFLHISMRCQKKISPIQIIWKFSHVNSVKVNTDGAARGCPSFSTCADIFRGSRVECICSFSSFLGFQKPLSLDNRTL